jgi:rare lipoprotein A
MSFIGCAGNSWLDDAARRILSDAHSFLPANFRNVVRLSAVVLAAAALGACAQSASNKYALRAAGQQTSLAGVHGGKHNLLARHKYAAKKFGFASFYDDTETANGEKFDPQALTAAHPTLPFGTMLRVTNVATGHSVTVRVNDRGPFVPGRVVDLSQSAAETIGIVEQGVAQVRLEVVH